MRKFWIDCAVATAFVFLVMWGIFGLTQSKLFNILDPIGQALADVELTDYVFSDLRLEDPNVDQNIVIVNIGLLSRGQIAQQINTISKYKPKVIGIDSFFDCKTGLRDTVNCAVLLDTLGNQMLSDAIRNAGNVILVNKVLTKKSTIDINTLDSLRRSDPMFFNYALADGFANLDTEAAYQDDVKTCRAFNPQLTVTDTISRAFSVEVALAYDSVITRKFLKRSNFSEIINYRGNVFDVFGTTKYPQMFYTLDVEDVETENFVSEMIKDKIVLFGFLGKELGDPSWADKFYTPLNEKNAGKANPDMFGVVVHANIISMIMNEDYIEQMARWQEISIAILVCLLNVALFSLINTRLPLWYDGITKLLQFSQVIVYAILMILIFSWYEYKLNITLTVAAVALVGDVYEIYMSVIKNTFFKIRNWVSITRKKDPVLMEETAEKR